MLLFPTFLSRGRRSLLHLLAFSSRPFRARCCWQNATRSGAFAKNKAEGVPLSAAKKKSFDKKNEAGDDQRILFFKSGKKKEKKKARERDLLLLFSEDLADGNWRSWQRALRQKEAKERD